MKRLNGWDAMLLYSETTNIPAHTLKIIVIDATDFDGDFTFEVFRDWVRGRLPLLDPLRYKLVEVPFKLHHPVWLENCEVDLDYHLRRVRRAQSRRSAGVGSGHRRHRERTAGP